jgi:tripartite-type tricarboxylate transporter receptor subunit TctC
VQAAINSPADGYTLLMAAHVHAINATLYQKLPYNFLNDIAPIAGLVRMPNVMEVTSSFPAKTVGEFIASRSHHYARNDFRERQGEKEAEQRDHRR